MSPAEENHSSRRTMPSSPAEEKHPSSLPSPEAATTEALKMSDEHPSSCTMLPVAATPEKIDDTTELNITVDFDNRSSKKKKNPNQVFWSHHLYAAAELPGLAGGKRNQMGGGGGKIERVRGVVPGCAVDEDNTRRKKRLAVPNDFSGRHGVLPLL